MAWFVFAAAWCFVHSSMAQDEPSSGPAALDEPLEATEPLSPVADDTAEAVDDPPGVAADLPEALDDLPEVAKDLAEADDEAAAREELVTRFEANIEFEQLVEAEDFEAAEQIGQRMVELTVGEFGAHSVESGDAHVALAEVQSRTGQFAAAEENFLVAIEVYRDNEGIYSKRLVRPLVGLGDAYHGDDQYLNAVSAYNEARTVTRRVFGLLNEDQIKILDRMTRSFADMNQYSEADEQQREALRLVQRNNPEQSEKSLEALYKYAAWLRESRRYGEEREHYQRAIRIIRDHYGDESRLLVRPLRETGNSFRTQGAAVSQGISDLRQALEILQAQPEPDPLMLAEVWRDIGDWQVAFAKVGPDGEEYQRAWALLGAVENGDELRRRWFSGIDYVFREPLSQRGLSAEPDAPSGFVLVKFDIDAGGRTDNVQVVEADPVDLKEEAVARHVRLSRFRPHMRDGELVLANNLALRITYRYMPDEDD